MLSDTTPVGMADRERLLVLLAYGCFLLSVVAGLPLLVGVIIAMVRKPHARGTLYESHYRNLILVFFVILAFASLLVAAAMAGMINLTFGLFTQGPALYWPLPLAAALIPAAAMGSMFLGLWFFWRVLRGFIRALDEKPY